MKKDTEKHLRWAEKALRDISQRAGNCKTGCLAREVDMICQNYWLRKVRDKKAKAAQ